MSKLEWIDGNRIAVDPPAHPKKITGTRFGAILGVNRWTTPFAAWCEITRTYEKPFEDTKYTLAGKAIEPKQANFAKYMCGFPGFVTPEDRFGKDYFKQTYGDFFRDTKVFGGMWDYLSEDNGEITVLEMKTTKRKEDWEKDIPEYYALQAALYAYLLGSDSVCMVASFLEDKDYENPKKFVPSVRNTKIYPFKLHKRYPNFEKDYIRPALAFWNECVLTGVSPAYDEKKDAEILAELRKKVIDISKVDKDELIQDAEKIQAELDGYELLTKPLEKQLKIIKEALKTDSIEMLDAGTKKVVYAGSQYGFTVTKQEGSKIDVDALKRDGLLEKYSIPTITYKLTVSKYKEGDN